MPEQLLDVRPVAGSLGAEIFGADLSQDDSNQAYDEIHQAFLDHQVLFIRDQKLTPPQQAAFARRFGPLNIYPFVEGLKGTPEIIEIVKEPGETKNFGGVWHSDTTYLDCPPLGTVLYALEVPPAGGDTMYANMYDAYDALSQGMKDLLAPLVAVHDFAVAAATQYAQPIVIDQDFDGNNQAKHPVVRTHPDTGRKSLFVNPGFTSHLLGFDKPESDALLGFLYAHMTQPEFIYRQIWQENDLIMWDNRLLMHYAISDYGEQPRYLERTTLIGERPA